MTDPAEPLPHSPEPETPPKPRAASLWQVASAVFWSFFGVRKGRHMQQDTLTIKPHHVIIVGLVAGLLFVLSLIAIVSIILKSAG